MDCIWLIRGERDGGERDEGWGWRVGWEMRGEGEHNGAVEGDERCDGEWEATVYMWRWGWLHGGMG